MRIYKRNAYDSPDKIITLEAVPTALYVHESSKVCICTMNESQYVAFIRLEGDLRFSWMPHERLILNVLSGPGVFFSNDERNRVRVWLESQTETNSMKTFVPHPSVK